MYLRLLDKPEYIPAYKKNQTGRFKIKYNCLELFTPPAASLKMHKQIALDANVCSFYAMCFKSHVFFLKKSSNFHTHPPTLFTPC